MLTTALFINSFALICLALSALKDRQKTKKSLKIAVKFLIKIVPLVLLIIILIGWLLAFLPQEVISSIIGQKVGFFGVLSAALLGTVLHIPSLVAFPLAASLLESGASVMAVAAFITTLTMIGFVTLPLEIKELGKKIALLRNGFSFLAALIIALIMGVILR